MEWPKTFTLLENTPLDPTYNIQISSGYSQKKSKKSDNQFIGLNTTVSHIENKFM